MHIGTEDEEFKAQTATSKVAGSGIRIWWTYEYHFFPNSNTKRILFGIGIKDGKGACC